MQAPYLIGQTKPLTPAEFQQITDTVPFLLPVSYRDFLYTYGLGAINELLMIHQPDEAYIRSNFGEYMDLWELPESEEPAVLNGLTIATTIDGDIIALIDDSQYPFIILPRHSDKILRFAAFEEVIDYYDHTYHFSGDVYFDSYYHYEQENITFVNGPAIDKALFEKVHQDFLAHVPFDKVYNAERQPKYVIQEMGGWVYFDNIYQSSVRIKYQSQYRPAAGKVIQFIRDRMK
ncbi:hypothetical protein [Chitinophaga sp. ARDCPP14]|uniref:hypothetical protein n=1 Tax=Chitinophaga sp. ARDCPP14 TaxID=3391139 RepID=UPI003F528B7F